MRNHDGRATGLLQDIECNLPEALAMASDSLEAENQEIRLFSQVDNGRDNPRTAFNAD